MLFAQATDTSSDAAAAGIGIALILALVAVGVIVLVWYFWLLFDMLKYPDQAWVTSAQNKQLWIILWVVGFCAGASLIIGLIYQLAIRPKVRQAAGTT